MSWLAIGAVLFGVVAAVLVAGLLANHHKRPRR